MKSWMTAPNPDGTLGYIDRTLEELLPALTKQFIPSISVDILQMKWDRISQFRDERIRSITFATAELRALTLQLPHISDFSKKQWLLSAMIPELSAQVRPHILPTSTWDEIVQLAERFDAARVMAKRQNGDSSSKNKKPFQKRPSYAQVLTMPSTFSRPGNPRQPSTPKPPFKCHQKLTPELRKQLMAEGKCLFCREKGHILSNCHKRPQNLKSVNVTSRPEVTSDAISVKWYSSYQWLLLVPSPPTHSNSSRIPSDPDHSTLS